MGRGVDRNSRERKKEERTMLEEIGGPREKMWRKGKKNREERKRYLKIIYRALSVFY